MWINSGGMLLKACETDEAVTQGITEQLKSENALELVQKMNNIQVCAREIVERELIFAYAQKGGRVYPCCLFNRLLILDVYYG